MEVIPERTSGGKRSSDEKSSNIYDYEQVLKDSNHTDSQNSKVKFKKDY
jgi:hypothetical protein